MQRKSWLAHFTRSDWLSRLAAGGLVIFIVSTLLQVGFLVLDWWLEANGYRTITERVTQSWWWIVAVSALIGLGWVGVTVHLILFRLQNVS